MARVKEAGAIVSAKTNEAKWSGDSQTHNELFGVTRNPWDDSLWVPRIPSAPLTWGSQILVVFTTMWEI